MKNIKKSNENRSKINQLEIEITKVTDLIGKDVWQNGKLALEWVDEMKELMIKEKIHDPVSERNYSYEAFRLSCAMKNLKQAQKWIDNAYKLSM